MADSDYIGTDVSKAEGDSWVDSALAENAKQKPAAPPQKGQTTIPVYIAPERKQSAPPQSAPTASSNYPIHPSYDPPAPPPAAPTEHSDFPTPTINGVKTTYFGYKGDADLDSASAKGVGDAGWEKRGGSPMIPLYSAALTRSQRAALFPKSESSTSTGLEFQWLGRTLRDDDTAPEADRRVDIFAPGHPPDAAGTPRYYGGNAEFSTSQNPPETRAPINEWKDSDPELSKYSDSEILSALKPTMAPGMSDDDFSNAAYDPNGANLIKEAYNKLTPLQQSRAEFPEYNGLDDTQFARTMYGAMEKQGLTNGATFDQFNDKFNPPSNILTSIANGIGSFFYNSPMMQAARSPGGGSLWDKELKAAGDQYQKMFSEIMGDVHAGAAGIEGIPQDIEDRDKALVALPDKLAKLAGINTNMQQALENFRSQFAKNPVGDFFRGQLNALNQSAIRQNQAAKANFEKAKGLNPVAKLGADIVGQTPDFIATFGIGGDAKIATATERMGRILWPTIVGATTERGRAEEAKSKNVFMQQSRAGMSDALTGLLLSLPYTRLEMGFANALIGANNQDFANWIEGKPNRITQDDILPRTLDFGMALMWGHDGVSDASRGQFEASQKARDAGNLPEATKAFDMAFALMPDEEVQQHAQNFITLTDILANNTFSGGDALKVRKIESPLDQPVDISDFRLRQEHGFGEVHFDPDESLDQPYDLRQQVGVDDPDHGLFNAGPKTFAEAEAERKLARADTPEKAARLSATEKPPQNERLFTPPKPEVDLQEGKTPPKAQPLSREDVARFTRQRFYKQRGQSGASINPAQVAAEKLAELKEALSKTKVGEAAHEISTAFDPGKYGPKAKEAEAQIGAINSEMATAINGYTNSLYYDVANRDVATDLDLNVARQTQWNKYKPKQWTDMLIKQERGEPTGDPIIDEMRRVEEVGYQELADIEHSAGVTYELRNNYLYHADLWESEKDREIFFNEMSKKFADPDFLHPRDIKSIEQGLLLGKKIKPTTGNELFARRVMDHFKTMSRVDALDIFEADGEAYKTTDPNMPEEARTWPEIRSPKRKEGSNTGTTYRVRPEMAKIMQRAWDPMFKDQGTEKVAGSFIRGLKAFKVIQVPFRLGLSIGHAIHVMMIRAPSRWMYLMRDRMTERPQTTTMDFLKAAVEAPTFGAAQAFHDVRKWDRLNRAMQGDAEATANLNTSEQWAWKQLKDAGYGPGMSPDKISFLQQHITQALPKWLKENGQWNTFTKFGHQLVSHVNFQDFTFHHLVPSIKMAHVLERIKDLYNDRPELLDDANKAKRLMELRKITQSADRRFGEMFYDNNFSVKWIKNLGIGTFLSAAWQLGLVDHANGLLDLAKSPLRMKEVIEQFKKRGAGAAGRELITDRMGTAYLYVGIAMAANAMKTYLNMKTKAGGDRHAFGWMDTFYPWAGIKPNGEDLRERPLTFPTELLGLGYSVATKGSVATGEQVTGNKLNGTLSAMFQAFQNVNYLGNKISDHDFNFDALNDLQGLWDRTQYVFVNSFSPIGGDKYAKPFIDAYQGRPAGQVRNDAGDALSAFLGFNTAPAWTGRTAIANEIMAAKRKAKGDSGAASVAQQRRWTVEDNLREALQSGTQGEQERAIYEALQAGISEKTIHEIRAHKFDSPDKRAWKALESVPTPSSIPGTTQLELLKKMTHEERVMYWPGTHEKAKEAYQKGLRHNPLTAPVGR